MVADGLGSVKRTAAGMRDRGSRIGNGGGVAARADHTKRREYITRVMATRIVRNAGATPSVSLHPDLRHPNLFPLRQKGAFQFNYSLCPLRFCGSNNQTTISSSLFNQIIGNGSRALRHALGMASAPVANTTMPPTIAQVVSQSPPPLRVCQIAAS